MQGFVPGADVGRYDRDAERLRHGGELAWPAPVSQRAVPVVWGGCIEFMVLSSANLA